MRESVRTPKAGLSPGVLVLGLAVVFYFLSGPGAGETLTHVAEKVREVVQLYREYQRLVLQNAELEQLTAFCQTPEGKELLLRGRFNMVRRGEYVVHVKEVAPEPEKKKCGLRAIIDGLRAKANENLSALAMIHKMLILTRTRNWPPVGC